MTVISRCGACEPDSDAAELMGDELAATCAHCGSLVTRQRKWKHDGAGIVMADDVFICTPPDERPNQATVARHFGEAFAEMVTMARSLGGQKRGAA